MKKLLTATIIIALILTAAACADKDPSPAGLPLDTKSLAAITSEYDNTLSVKEKSVSQARADHILYFPEYPDMDYAGVITGVNDNKKIVNMTFGAGTGMAETLNAEPYASKAVTTENVKDTLVYAAKLYGFEDENALAEAFSEESMTEKDSSGGYNTYTWTGEVMGCDCKIVFNEPAGSGTKVLFTVSLTGK